MSEQCIVWSEICNLKAFIVFAAAADFLWEARMRDVVKKAARLLDGCEEVAGNVDLIAQPPSLMGHEKT